MSHATRLRHRVGEVIARQALWQAGDRVAVAVSGGLDSVVLLDVLVATQRWHGAVLSVVHVDHGVRDGSREDAAFVASLAAAHELPLHSERCEGLERSEASLREARHAVFETLDVERVALGHHRDDQAETFLLQALRGAGARGAGAMRWTRGRLARPLLGEPRSALEAWAASHDLSWRQDPSNADPAYLRNRVRHEVMPLLESLRSGAAETLARTAMHLADDDAVLSHQVEALASELTNQELLALPTAMARRWLLRRWSSAESRHVDALLGLAAGQGSRVVLPGGVAIRVAGGKLREEPA